MDMVDPQPTLVELLVRHVLLPCALLPQIEINSYDVVPSGIKNLPQKDRGPPRERPGGCCRYTYSP
jgi:hypothetical protein